MEQTRIAPIAREVEAEVRVKEKRIGGNEYILERLVRVEVGEKAFYLRNPSYVEVWPFTGSGDWAVDVYGPHYQRTFLFSSREEAEAFAREILGIKRG